MTHFTQPHPLSPRLSLHVYKDEGGWRLCHRPMCCCGGCHSISNRSAVSRGQGRVRCCRLASTVLFWVPDRPLKFPPSLTMGTNWARFVIFSILDHWYQHMSGKGYFMCTVTHIQSELAAWIPVTAVAFTQSLQLPCCFQHAASLSHLRAHFCLWLRVFLCSTVLTWLPCEYVYHMVEFIKTQALFVVIIVW